MAGQNAVDSLLKRLKIRRNASVVRKRHSHGHGNACLLHYGFYAAAGKGIVQRGRGESAVVDAHKGHDRPASVGSGRGV